MNTKAIRATIASTIAGAGLVLGAGLASADTIDTMPVADGNYTLSVYGPPPVPLGATVGSVPATVTDGHLVVAGVPVQGAALEAYDSDGDGHADRVAVLIGDSNVGHLQ